jgi:diacylglycerol kinase (ATP)
MRAGERTRHTTTLIDEIDGDVVSSSVCLIVANPAAAGVDDDTVREISDRMSRRARTVRTVWTERAGHAAEVLGSNSDAGLVVAVGGDGTVNELAQALAGDPAPRPILCALPAGSGNSTARNLFGDRDWRQILDLLDSPRGCRTRHLDLLRLLEPGITAVLGVATGVLAHVLLGARGVDAGLTGIDRYYAAAVDVLQAMPSHPTRVTVDGIVISDGPTSSVAVGGGRFRARTFQFLPRSLLDDGLVDVSTIDALDAAAVAELLPLVPAGAHLGRPDVHYGRGRTVVIERTDGRPLVAEFDGSVWDAAGARLTVEVMPNALRVLGAADCPCG